MTFLPNSALVDSVLVAEAYSRNGAPILGVVIHMAEGGGTDTWLTRLDGNSSHYVIKYSGKLVQLVPETMAAGSMNPRATRTTDDAPFTFGGETIRYGRTALNAVLGAYAPTLINRAVIAIEIEGFASAGPSNAQNATLVDLIADIRKRRGPVGLLGHRDQQAYKACPGKRIPWYALGGHGPATIATPESDDVTIPLSVNSLAAYDVTIKAGTQLYDQAFRPLVEMERDTVVDGLFATGTGYLGINIVTGGIRQLALVKSGTVAYGPKPQPAQPIPVEVTANGKVVGTVILP